MYYIYDNTLNKISDGFDTKEDAEIELLRNNKYDSVSYYYISK